MLFQFYLKLLVICVEIKWQQSVITLKPAIFFPYFKAMDFVLDIKYFLFFSFSSVKPRFTYFNTLHVVVEVIRFIKTCRGFKSLNF